MSDMLFRIRKQQQQVITHEIDSWKRDHIEAMGVRDLEELIQACLLNRDSDHSFINGILGGSHTLSQQMLDALNRGIQECCDDALDTLNKLSEHVRLAEAKGFTVENASSIAKAAEDYRRWKEDTPELLLLHYKPVTGSNPRADQGCHRLPRSAVRLARIVP